MDDMKRYLLLGFGIVTLVINNHAWAADKGAAYQASPQKHESKNEWTVGAGALYLQPSYSQTPNYGKVTLTNLSDSSTQSDTLYVDSEYLWGYEAFLSYRFAEHDRDIALHYMHLSGTETDSTSLGTAPAGYAYVASPFYFTGEGKVYTSVDSAELVAGQGIKLHKSLDLRIYAGVEYARIQQDITKVYDKDLHPFAAVVSTVIKSNSQFNGAGPLLGANADYEIGHSHFGLMAGVSAALLVGTLDQGNTVTYAPNTQGDTNQDNDFPATADVVTNINANLALRYNLPMKHNRLHFELGYQVNQYFDAVATNTDLTLSGFYLDVAASFK